MQVSSPTSPRQRESSIPYFLLRPVGYSNNNSNTTGDIKEWEKRENPSILEKSSPLTIGGAIGILVGLLFTAKQRENLKSPEGMSGIALLVLGLITSVVGVVKNPVYLKEEAEKQRSKEAETNPDREKHPIKNDDIGNQTDNICSNHTTSEPRDLRVTEPHDRKTTTPQNHSTLELTNDIDELIKIFNDMSNQKDIRIKAGTELGKSTHRKALKPLTDCVKRKKDDPDVRAHAACLVGLRTKPHEITRIVKAVLPILQDKKENIKVRQAVTLALSEIGDENVLKVLRTIQGDIEEKFISETINYAVEKIEERLSKS